MNGLKTNKVILKSTITYRLKKVILTLLAMFLSVIGAYTQTGPAGVGDATGGSTLNIWFKADDGVTYDGSNNVSSWINSAGNSDLNLGVEDGVPVYISNALNGRPAVSFDNSDADGNERMISGGNLSPSTFPTDETTVYFVSSYDNSHNSYPFTSWGYPGNPRFGAHLPWGGNYYIDLGNATNGQGRISGSMAPYPSGSFYAWSATMSPDSGKTIYVNNKSINSAAGFGTFFNHSSYRFQLGHSFRGDIAEIIIFSERINLAQRNIISNYLNTKYGLPIVNGDIFTPGAASYTNDIAGIGQESDGDHAFSSSAGMYIQSTSGLDIAEYVFLAHSGDSNNVNNINTGTEITSSGAEAAFNRIWWLDKTGNLDAELSFKLSEAFDGGQFPEGDLSNYVLLNRASTSGNFSIVKSADQIVENDRIVFDLSDAQMVNGYYTLATMDQILSPIEGVGQTETLSGYGPAKVGNTLGTDGQPRNVLWLDASFQQISDGSSVSSFNDRSGNSAHATSTGDDRPTFIESDVIANNRSLMRFFGADAGDSDHLVLDPSIGTTTDGIANNNFTVFTVAARRAVGENWILAGLGSGPNNGNLHWGWRNNGQQFAFAFWANDVETWPVTGTSQLGIYTGTYDGSAATTRRVFENSDQIGSSTNATPLSQWNGAAIARHANGNSADIDVAEVIFYQGELNDAQRIIVENYLGAKYNIPLLANEYFSGHDALYTYEVVGVGQEANGNHLTTNTAGLYLEATGGLDDGDYLIAGHNNSANSSSTTDDLPAGVEERWKKDFYIEKTGNLDATIAFDFPEGITGGLLPDSISNYTLLYRNTTTGNYSEVTIVSVDYEESDQVAFQVVDANILNGYYTIGTTNASGSPLTGIPATYWYTLTSGDWNDHNIWTLDPGGVNPDNPDNRYPLTGKDIAVVKSGNTVTVTHDSINISGLTVEGRLDLALTKGHAFTTINGFGRILLSSNQFPSGDATHFISKDQGEGTVEFYGGSYILNTQHTFYNMVVNLDNTANIFTLTQDLKINNNLTIEQGIFKINDDALTVILDIEVDGDLTVNADGQISVGTGNTIGTYSIPGTMPGVGSYHDIYHQLILNGNFTNNGTVRFTNLNAPVYDQFAGNGAVTICFEGDQDNSVELNGISDFYNLVIEKGVDQSKILEVYADDISYFRLFGANNVGRNTGNPFSTQDPENRKALWIKRGTLKLTGNIHIPSLSEGFVGGGSNGDYAIGQYSKLWVADPTVTVHTTARDADDVPGFTNSDTYQATGFGGTAHTALSLLGALQVSDGLFTTRNSWGGLVMWASPDAVFQIDGGRFEAVRFLKTGGGMANYLQTGGDVVVTGGSFDLNDADIVFSMSDGTIEIQAGDYYVGSAVGNYSVIGGTVYMDLNWDRNISSTANLYNLDIQTSSGARTMYMQDDLVISNNLTIGDNSVLHHQGNDLTIGGNFTIASLGDYFFDSGTPNTTTINGNSNSRLAFYNRTGGTNDEQHFSRFIINKEYSTNRITLESAKINRNGTNNNLMRFRGTSFELLNGIFDNGEHSLRFYTDTIVNYGTLGVFNPANAEPDATANGNNDQIKFRPSSFELITNSSSVFGNVRLNNGDEIVNLTSDVYMQRIQWRHGRMNLGTYNLKLDELHVNLTGESDFGGCGGCASVEDMFITNGNASDGGLTIYIPSDGIDPKEGDNIFEFPLGLGTDGISIDSGGVSKYTPAFVTLTNVIDDGYITIRPVDNILATTEQTGGDILSYYWKVTPTDFTVNPTVEYEFKYYDDDVPTIDRDTLFMPGKVLEVIPYTRSYENDLTKVNDTLNTINFNGSGAGFPLESASYTCGDTNRFIGSPTVYYSTTINDGNDNDRNRNDRWNETNLWSTVGHYSGVNTGTYPQAGDIAIMGFGLDNPNDVTDDFNRSHWFYVNGSVDVARLLFANTVTNADGVVVPRSTSYSPQIIVEASNAITMNLGLVDGEGTFNVEIECAPCSADPAITIPRISEINGDFGGFADNTLSRFDYDLSIGNSRAVYLPTGFPTVYPNVHVKGMNGSNRVLIFQEDIQIKRDLTIRQGATVRLSNTLEGDIDVGGNVDFTINDKNDRLEFPSDGTVARTMRIGGDIIMENNSDIVRALDNNSAADVLIHTLQVEGNIYQASGQIDLYTGAEATRDQVILELTGENSAQYTRTDDPAMELYRLVVNKQGTTSPSFIFNDDFTLNGPTSGAGIPKALDLQNGNLILNDPLININLTTGDDDFNIPPSASLDITQGQVRASGNSGIFLDGRLLIKGGTLDMSGGDNHIEYSASGNAQLDITSGSLIVGSQIRRQTITTVGALRYTQTGGTVVVGENTAPVGNRGVFEIIGAGSAFNHYGGDLFIARGQAGATVASLILDPESSTITNGTTINLGYNTTPLDDNIDINSTIALKNITQNNLSGNNFTTSLFDNLTVEEDILVETGVSFVADKNLILKGDLTNNGSFYGNDNYTLTLNGSNTQTITGNIDVYDVTKPGTQSIILATGSNTFNVRNIFDFQGGVISDNDNTIAVQGDINFEGQHIYGGSGDGILLNGILTQNLTGDGTFGKLSINNSAGIDVPVGNDITITNALKLEDGVFNIDKNLLSLSSACVIEEANPFGTSNMIQTNTSFTDAGVRKYYNTGAENFTYPIGSGGKYTPVTFDITQNTSNTGYVTVIAANEPHPSVQEDVDSPELVDKENALQYYWTVNANNITGFVGDAFMVYDPADALCNSADYDTSDYITARLLNDGTGNWNKFTEDKVHGASTTLEFNFGQLGAVDDDQITGDYTAGIDDAIPDKVPFYETNNDGIWPTAGIWTPNITGGPAGAMVRINAPHTVTVPGNFLSSYTTEVQGTVVLNTTFGHRFGIVTGSGTIYTEREVIPAGVYDDFFLPTGGTLEYGGSTDNDVLGGLPLTNNVTFSGTGLRRLPSNNLDFNGDFRIDGLATLSVENNNNIDMEIKGDFIRAGGTFGAGSNISTEIEFNGAANQDITGNFTGSNGLNTVKINNPNGITLNSGSVDISGTLYLTDGIVTTSSSEIMKLNVNASISPAGVSATSYINGPLTKVMRPADDFTFPVGKSGEFGSIELNNINNLAGLDAEVTVENFFGNPHVIGDTSALGLGVDSVCTSEYWQVNVAGGGRSTLSIDLDGSCDIANNLGNINDLILVGWSGTEWSRIGGSYTITGNASAGNISCNSDIDYSNYQYITLGSDMNLPTILATISSGDISICSGNSTNIVLSFNGGTAPWTYTLNGSDHVAASSPHFHSVSPAVTTTYTLTAIDDANSISGTVTGNNDVVITVGGSLTVTLTNNTSGDEICAGTSVTFTAGGGTNYEFFLNGGSVQSGTSNTYTTSSLANGDQIYVEASSGGCNGTSSTTTITVNTLPTPTITGDTVACEEGTKVFNITNNGNSYSWSVTGGVVQSGQNTSSATILWDQLTPVGTLSNTETITLTEITPESCVGSDTHSVTIWRRPRSGSVHHINNDWSN